MKDPETSAIYTRPEDKRSLLTRTLLQKAACQEDVPIAFPDEHQSARLSLPSASRHEIENALLRTKETTPGPDEIPITAIRRAWPQVREAVCILFEWCLELGWHPTPFRAATLVTIPNQGKAEIRAILVHTGLLPYSQYSEKAWSDLSHDGLRGRRSARR